MLIFVFDFDQFWGPCWAPLGTHLGLQIDPKSIQKIVKNHLVPTCPQETTPRGHKTAPRGPQTLPRGSKEGTTATKHLGKQTKLAPLSQLRCLRMRAKYMQKNAAFKYYNEVRGVPNARFVPCELPFDICEMCALQHRFVEVSMFEHCSYFYREKN